LLADCDAGKYHSHQYQRKFVVIEVGTLDDEVAKNLVILELEKQQAID